MTNAHYTIGQYVEFKADIEQSAKIIGITRRMGTVFLELEAPADGFEGYACGHDTYEISTDQVIG